MSGGRMTPHLTAEVAREIAARAGARVRAVHQDGPHVIRLDLRDDDGRIDLVVDLAPAFPRVLLRPHRKAPPQPSGLAGALRKHLTGARVGGAEAVPGERALRIAFVRGEGDRTLWIELFGGQANWYLLDEHDGVLWTLRGEVAARREASKGMRFEPVPARDVPDSGAADAEAGGSETVRALSREARRGRTETSATARLRKVLKAHAKRARKAATTLASALEAAEGAEEIERKGELLRGAFHLLAPGLAEVVVPDYGQDPPVDVRIELDPTKPPGDQVGHCFARARRLRRAAKEARARHGEAPALLASLEDALARIAPDADDVPDLAAFVDALPPSAQADARNALKEPGAASTRKGPKTAQAWRAYTSADGWTILVGKDARANDELTLRKAKPQDLFLHVRGSPGSHVIVPTPRGKTVPRETLLDAAELACHFSPRRKAARNEVDYTPRRYVRKPKGSPPGLVLVERSKTLRLRLDEARRARLLASGAPGTP